MINADLNTALPEILLAVYAMVILMVAVYGGKDRLSGFVFWTTAVAMAALGLFIATMEPRIVIGWLRNS